MKSRVHPKYKTKYRVENWPGYDRALVQRGDLTLWISADAIEAWKPAPSGRRGGQREFADLAIETALTLRLVFKLPLRQTEGFLRSVLPLMGVILEAPDHKTLSRRSQHLNIEFHCFRAKEPLHLIVDSTGLSIVGEGKWAAVKHGGRGKRGWEKLHLGVDGTGVIVAQVLTDGSTDDAATALSLIDEGGGASRVSQRTQPTTGSRSTMPRERVARRSSFHQPKRRRDRGAEDHGQPPAVARSGECRRL